jgi:predicted dinucleotide-binding enzyme
MAHSILIVGAGNIGGTLGRAWLATGHDVRFGVPDPADQKYAELPHEFAFALVRHPKIAM